MAELKRKLFLFFVLLMIFPAHALDAIFSSANANFKQKYEIRSYIKSGQRMYGGTVNTCNYRAKPNTTNVIVYIIDRSRFVEIFRNAVRETRFQIANELSEWHHELVFLGIDNFDEDEFYLISAFMVEKIRPFAKKYKNFIIEKIGENSFDHAYLCHVLNIEEYQEKAQICGGTLRARLRSIKRGALTPIESIYKEIRLQEYRPDAQEVRWPVSVVNKTYFPAVNVSAPEYNFKMRHPDKRICLLILGGKEYAAATSYGARLLQKREVMKILDEMRMNGEVLYILGAFNFDWTEIDIVTQIILTHSDGWREIERWKHFAYNIFSCGYGMFNTAYLNMDAEEERFIFRQTKSHVSDMIKMLMGKELKGRTIHMQYFDGGWNVIKMPINMGNGKYTADEKFENFTFPWLNQKIAFIVYDPTERSDRSALSVVLKSVEKLKRSGIRVVLVRAINFEADDIYIIAEWIDWHRGTIETEQIAILGGGIFDTIFQSGSTTYNTLLKTKKNELKAIRNAYVKSGNGKKIFAAKIDDANFDVWTYPMNTVNGFYEPDLIPDGYSFDSSAGKKVFFIITDAHNFLRITAKKKEESSTKMLKEIIEQYYPYSEWNSYLVGFDNFGDRDYHLFAELVKKQIIDTRPLEEFVCTLNYGIGTAIYQYRDTLPLPMERRSKISGRFTSFFEWVNRNL